jgi:hypothetical protein
METWQDSFMASTMAVLVMMLMLMPAETEAVAARKKSMGKWGRITP